MKSDSEGSEVANGTYGAMGAMGYIGVSIYCLLYRQYKGIRSAVKGIYR